MTAQDDESNTVEQTTYLRTAFLERLAHELRGPAGVIQGALHELATALGEDAVQHEALFAMALRGVKRITRNADRLQQTGQLERGVVRLQREESDLTALLRRSVEDARALENRRNIEVEVNAPDPPLLAALDALWMGVALYELTSNAIRHASKRVQVNVTADTAWITVTFANDNPNGTAFGPTRFQPSRSVRGLGLALAIVRDVVSAHGGALEIRSGANESGERANATEVRLKIPRASGEATIAP